MSLLTVAAARRRFTGGIVLNAVTEWWISPVATHDPSNRRTVGGAVSGNRGDGNANVLAWEIDHSTGDTLQYAVGVVPVDDHNAPALWFADGRRPVITWTKHGGDQILHIKTATADGDLSSLVSAPDQGISVPGTSTYSQIYRIEALSTAADDVFWVFVRLMNNGWRWGIQELSVNQETGVVTPGAYRPFSVTGSSQSYATTADAYVAAGNQVIRVAVGFNPAMTRHDIHAFDIDTVTGDVTSLGNPALVANVLTGTGTPISLLAQTPAIADSPSGYSRRLFYTRPGPAPWGIGYADWSTAAVDEARYKLAEVTDTPGVWNVTDLGIVAGPRVGNIAEVNYIGGMAFRNPCNVDDPILVASKVAGGESVVQELHPDTMTARKIDGSYTDYLMRPMSPVGGGPIRSVHSGYTSYPSYNNYTGNVHAVP